MSELLVSVILPWLITFFLGLTIIISLTFLPQLIIAAAKLPRLVLLSLIVSLAAGFFLRYHYVPNFHRIFYDEDRYLSFAVSFARFGKATSIDMATQEKLLLGDPDKAVRLTVPVINAWVMKAFGYRELPLHQLAKAVSSFQIIIIFIFAAIYLRSYWIALFAAAGMAFLPNIIYWSSSTALDSYFVFFALFSSLSVCLFAKEQNIRSGILMLCTVFLLLCVRLEAFVFLPVLGFFYYFQRKANQSLAKIASVEIAFAGLALLLIGLRAFASLSVLGQKWCCAEALPLEAFYPNYFIRNLLPNIFNLFNRPEFPFIITIFSFIAIFQFQDKKILPLIIWSITFFFLYSLYYAGMFFSFEFSGSYGRYFLIQNPPLLLLAGITIDQLITQYQKNPAKKTGLILAVTAGIISFSPWFNSYKQMISASPYYKTVEESPHTLHRFTNEYLIANTPKNSIIIENLTANVFMSGRSVVASFRIINEKSVADFVVQALKEKKPVFSVPLGFCFLYPDQCRHITDRVRFEPVKMKKPHPLGLTFFQLKLKK